jgi:hypothetical protein
LRHADIAVIHPLWKSRLLRNADIVVLREERGPREVELLAGHLRPRLLLLWSHDLLDLLLKLGLHCSKLLIRKRRIGCRIASRAAQALHLLTPPYSELPHLPLLLWRELKLLIHRRIVEGGERTKLPIELVEPLSETRIGEGAIHRSAKLLIEPRLQPLHLLRALWWSQIRVCVYLIHGLIELRQDLLTRLVELVELLVIHIQLLPRARVGEKWAPQRIIEVKIVVSGWWRNKLLLAWNVIRILNLATGSSGCCSLACRAALALTCRGALTCRTCRTC